MTFARDAFATVVAVLSCIALTLGVAGAWLGDNVVDARGFMSVVSPMSADKELQQEFAESALADVLPGLPVPGWAREKVEELLTSQVHVVTESDAYGEIWDATMIDAHSQLLRGGKVELKADIAPVWDSMAQPIDDLLPFGWEVPVPERTMISLGAFDGSWFSAVQKLAAASDLLVAGATLGTLGALAVGFRRLYVLGVLGVSAITSGGVLWFLLANHHAFIAQGLVDQRFVGPVVSAFAARAAADLQPAAVWIVGVGLACFVVALAASAAVSAMRISIEKRNGIERPVGDRAIRYDAYDL